MTALSIKLLLDTATASVRDVVCSGECRRPSPAECAQSTFLVFPYRGVYLRHLGSNEAAKLFGSLLLHGLSRAGLKQTFRADPA